MDQPKGDPTPTKPKSKWLGWVRDIVLALLLVVLIQGWQARNLVQGQAPETSGYLLDGSPVSLDAYRGKPLLVHFWATWCPVCRMEEGTIQSLSEDYQVLTIAHQSGDADEVSAYLAQQNLSFPVLLDEDGQLGALWGASGVPASFVLDGQGQIKSIAVGYTTGLGLRARMWLAD